MLAYRKYLQSEEGMIETKSFAYRVRDFFRRKPRKPKVDSFTVYSILRVNTDTSNNVSCNSSFFNRQESTKTSKSFSKSFELARNIECSPTKIKPQNRSDFHNWPSENYKIDYNMHDTLPAPSAKYDYNCC